jgi:hypothetical protein
MNSNSRSNIAHTKTRGEVRGGGKKPWKQKGTGRSRHGSTRSPIWVGGGIAHGPRNTQNYDRKINKKAKNKAFLSILSKKYKEGEVLFVDNINIDTPKCLKNRAPSDVISMIAYSHPASTACRKNDCVKNLPGMVILYLFGRDSVPTLKRIVESTAVFFPQASRTAFTNSVVEDLPFVPVIPMT